MITGACMVPHPPIILPEVGRGEEKKIAVTADSFCKAARVIAESKPEVLIISTPHSVMYRDYFHVSPGKGAAGDMGLFRAPEVKFKTEYDTELTDAICKLAEEEGFPAGTEGEMEPELDHGVMVPLYFINKYYRDYKLVRVGLSGLSLKAHVKFGRLLRNAANVINKRVYYIASGDLSHKLKKSGPYGFDPAGPLYDEKIMHTMGNGAFQELTEYDPVLLVSAAECGHRSFCIMSGFLEETGFTAETLSHEDVFGVGYGVCIYKV